jgi:hypothetical protein
VIRSGGIEIGRSFESAQNAREDPLHGSRGKTIAHPHQY